MAGLEELAQALALQGKIRPEIAASDPYLQAQQPFDQIGQFVLGQTGQLKEDGTPRYSTKERIIAGLLSGLGSGVFSGLSKDYQGRAETAYQDVLNQGVLGKEIERPAVLDPALFSSASNAAKLFRGQRELEQQQSSQDVINALAKARGTKAAEVLGENDAWRTLNGAAPAVVPSGDGVSAAQVTAPEIDITKLNPNSPQYKALKTERDRGDNLFKDVQSSLESGPVAQNYRDRAESLSTLLANLNEDSTAGDLAIVSGYQRTIDPGVSVRGEDVKTIKEGQSFLDRLYGDTSGWFNSDGRLKPEFRKKIAAAAINVVNASGQQYQEFANKRLAQIANPEKIAYTPHKDFNLDDYIKIKTEITPEQARAKLKALGVPGY